MFQYLIFVDRCSNIEYWYSTNKNLPSNNGTGGRVPVVPPRLIVLRLCSGSIHFALTIISLSCNVEKTVRTTNVTMELDTSSHERLGRELRLVSVKCNFQRVHCISLAASTSLLSSVIALYWGRLLRFIICENGTMSRLRLSLVVETGGHGARSEASGINGLPRDRSRGSQRPTQREERVYFPNGHLICPLSL
jgi:hypothetical protein